MRHAVLGVGGVGGLVGGGLARAGHEVLLILRSREGYPGRLEVASDALGGFEVEPAVATRLDRAVDVLWVTVKATQLEAALARAPAAAAADAMVVPLLNGVDHLSRLRRAFGERVVAGAIRVEAEKVGPGRIVQRPPFGGIDLGPPPALRERAAALARELSSAGLTCRLRESEAEVLWTKLALLAPFALGTTVLGRPIGAVREDLGLWRLVLACAREVCAVAALEGVGVDPGAIEGLLAEVPAGFRSSMQKDRSAGRPLEVAAIAGPVLDRGLKRGIPTPATEALARRLGWVAPSVRGSPPGDGR